MINPATPYLLPTAAGAYQAVCAPDSGAVQRLMMALLSETSPRPVSAQMLSALAGTGADEAQALTERLLKLGMLEPLASPVPSSSGPVESWLPPLLAPLSSRGRALLAQREGLYIARAGFTHEAAEELAAYAADCAALVLRHTALLHGNLRLSARGVTLADAGGLPQLGVWPLCVGQTEFLLVLDGLPRLNQPAFRDLIVLLCRRYAAFPVEQSR